MPRPRVTFPDAEMMIPKALRDALAATWPGLYVGRTHPTTARSTFVLVRRQGGGQTSRLIDAPRVGITVWAPDDVTANRLSADIVQALMELEGRSAIGGLVTTGPSDISDDSSDSSRRFISAAYLVRGT